MWPWEHLAFGYLTYRGLLLVAGRPGPDDRAVLVLLFVTQLPDLVDKPLAWIFQILPSATSLAHSVLFAGPVVLAAWLLGWRLETPWLGPVVAIGYATHLVGDVLYPALLGLGLGGGYLLWPISPQTPNPPTPVGEQVLDLLDLFIAFLATPRGLLYLLGEVAILAIALVVWIRDGVPGVALLRRLVMRGFRSV